MNESTQTANQPISDSPEATQNESLLAGDPVKQKSGNVLDLLSNEELKHEPSLQSFKDVDALAKSYVHAQKLVGGDKMPVPNEKWTPEQWNEHFNRLGRPESSDNYEMPELPEGTTLDENMNTMFRGVMHEAGLSQKQYEKIVGAWNEYAKSQIETHQAEAQENFEAIQTELKKEWGGKYDQNVYAAKKAVRMLGGEELAQVMNETGIGNHPLLIRAFARAGEHLLEDSADGSGPMDFGLGHEQAKAEIGKLKANSEFLKVLNNQSAPGHKEAVEKWNRLFELAYSNEKKN